MAKTRMLKHNLRTSEKVASWPFEIRYFWTLLWGYVDDHGKGKDNPLLVKADTLPLDPDVTVETVDEWLWVLAEDDVIVRYTVEATDYLAVVNWTEHQKPPHPTKDVLPGPDDVKSIRRELPASRMKDAGKPHASLTHGLGLGLGLVKSGSGSGSEWSRDGMSQTDPPRTDNTLVIAELEQATFDEFYAIWPKKRKRPDAQKAWDAAIKRHPADQILAAARAYVDNPHRQPVQFVPYPATWLRADGWGDDLDGPPEAQRTTMTRGEKNLAYVQQLAAQQAAQTLGIRA